MRKAQGRRFVVCIKNDDCEDLELRKVYQVLPDKKGSQEGYLRIVDESGEDYVYPESYFVALTLSPKARVVLLAGRQARRHAKRTPRVKPG